MGVSIGTKEGGFRFDDPAFQITPSGDLLIGTPSATAGRLVATKAFARGQWLSVSLTETPGEPS